MSSLTALLNLLMGTAYIGHFLKGGSLKSRCNIRVHVPLSLSLCVPPLPPLPRSHCGAEQQNRPPHSQMTPHPRSRIRTRKQWHDLPLGRTTLGVVSPILVNFSRYFRRSQSSLVNVSRIFPRFQSALVNFSQFQSALVNFSQFQADHTRQKRRNFVPTGKWGETTPKQ